MAQIFTSVEIVALHQMVLPPHTVLIVHGRVAKLADALDLGSSPQGWRFKSSLAQVLQAFRDVPAAIRRQLRGSQAGPVGQQWDPTKVLTYFIVAQTISVL